MYKSYVAALILFYCYFDVKSIRQCDIILRKKGYPGVIEKVKSEIILKGRYISRFSTACTVGKQFSVALFRDAEAWLCLKDIVKLLEDNMDLYNNSIQFCLFSTIPHRWNAINCGALDDFENCINYFMKYTLKSLAEGEPKSQKPCLKCRESYYLRRCAKTMKRCPKITQDILKKNVALKSCKICSPNHNITYLPPELKIPKFTFESDNVGLICSTNSSDVRIMVFEFKSSSPGKKQKVLVKSRSDGAHNVIWESVDKNFIVERFKSSRQKLYARLKSVQCKHSGLYSCYAEYLHPLKRLNSTYKRMEVIKRMTKPILSLENRHCEESSTRCQNCASHGQHSCKSNEILTINCTMNVSLPVNSSHGLKWYYAVDGGELSEVKHGKSGAAISEVSQNFRYGSCTGVKQKTTTLRIITPQLGKVLRLRCMLVFKAQDLVYKFQDSIEICILERMRKPILSLEDRQCEETSTRCQNCASYGQHSRKSNESFTINCTMNVSLHVNSSHGFKWHYAVDGGELSEVKHGKSGAAISEVSQNFRYRSCTGVKQKTTTLRFITPQLGKVLRLRCMLVFEAQDLVEKFQDSIDICILDGRETRQPNKDGDGKTTPQTGPRKDDEKTTLGKSKWILISVAAAVVILCLAISMYYYNQYLDARDNSINKRKVAEIQKSSIRLKSEYKSFIYDGKLVIDLVPSKNALETQEVERDADEVASAEDISMCDTECSSVRNKK